MQLQVNDINQKVIDSLPNDFNVKLFGEADEFYDVMNDKMRIRAITNSNDVEPISFNNLIYLQGFHLVGDIDIEMNSKNFNEAYSDYNYTFVINSKSIELLNHIVSIMLSFTPDISITKINRSTIDVMQKYWKVNVTKKNNEAIDYQRYSFAISYKINNVKFTGKCLDEFCQNTDKKC